MDTHIQFAKRFGFLDAGDDVGGIIASIEKTVAYSSQIGIYNEWHPVVFKLVSLIFGPQAMAQTFNIQFAEKAISERKAHMDRKLDGPPDFLSKYLQSHSEDPETFTNYNVFIGCFQNIIAGSDTTGISLSAILYNLCKNPTAAKKLREEVDATQPKTFQDAQKMPYLQAVIKEALRMHPVTGMPLWRVVPEGGVTLNDKFFPEGVSLLITSSKRAPYQ